MARIIFVLEEGQEEIVPLTERVTIGRGAENDVQVDDERISPQHAELLQNADGSVQVFDLNSESGTFVNGERQKSCTLLHGDKLAFGPLNGRLELEHMEPAAAAPHKGGVSGNAEEMARMEAEKQRLEAAVRDLTKEALERQKHAEKEHAVHLARVASLRAEEEQLAPVQAALQDAISAHSEWMDAIARLSARHEEKTAALEKLDLRHAEKTAEAATLNQEVKALNSRLKQLRDECEQQKGQLVLLHQQIKQLEKSLKEQESRQSANAASDAALAKKRQKEEAAVNDLRLLLNKLEQQETAAKGAARQRQDDLAACEKKLQAKSKALEQENQRLEQAVARRAEIDRQCQELAGVKQQLADERLRLAAVEQRLRDARAEPPPQIAAVRRRPAKENPAAPDGLKVEHHQLMRQIDEARQELAGLQAGITAARAVQAAVPAETAGGEPTAMKAARTIPSPLIVHVEPVRLASVSMKSERAKASAPAAAKVSA